MTTRAASSSANQLPCLLILHRCSGPHSISDYVFKSGLYICIYVLSPILFTLITNDCTGTDTTPVIKYSDDSAVEDFSNSDSILLKLNGSVTGAGIIPFFFFFFPLDLNVKKKKKGNTDFRKAPTVIPDLFTDGVKVELLSTNI